MKNKVNRKNDCTVHFMVSQQEMEEINRRFNQTSYRTKREFYRDSILKNKIISIDLDGKIGNELRKLSSMISRNSNNINQITKIANNMNHVDREALKFFERCIKEEARLILNIREMITNHIINEAFL